MAHSVGNTKTHKSKKRLMFVFILTAFYMLAEAVGGVVTGSLALLADAGHMLTDAGALGLSLLAIRFAERPATAQKTYGFLRAEILAALANATALLLVTVYILFEAWRRFSNPPEVMSWPMLIVASIGLVINVVGTRMLADAAKDSLNVKGAYLEVLSDTLGSLGVIVASLIMMKTGWYLVDPIIGAAIGLFIVPRTWKLLSESVHILMEGTPYGIDLSAVEQKMNSVSGVTGVHDLHVWTITSGVDSLSAHVVVRADTQADAVLRELKRVLEDGFNIGHTTIQLEPARFAENEMREL